MTFDRLAGVPHHPHDGADIAGDMPSVKSVHGVTLRTHAARHASGGDDEVPDAGTDLTTKGDLHGYDAGQARIPIGTDDQVLTADSAASLGVKWASLQIVGESRLLVPPTSGWSWVNQGSATETVQSDGAITVNTPAVGSLNLVGRVRSYSAPLKTQARIACSFAAGGDGGVGLWFRESSSSELHAFYAKPGGALLQEKWNSPTSFNGGDLSGTWGEGAGPFWLEIEDDNTDLHFRISVDGYEYVELGNVGRTSFMAGGPDEWGWFLRDETQNRVGTLTSWEEL